MHCRQTACMAKSEGDPSWRVFIRFDHWELSERVPPAHPCGQIHCSTRVRLPKVREDDCALRQHSGAELADPWGEMQKLQNKNFRHVPGRRIADRTAVPGLLFRL